MHIKINITQQSYYALQKNLTNTQMIRTVKPKRKVFQCMYLGTTYLPTYIHDTHYVHMYKLTLLFRLDSIGRSHDLCDLLLHGVRPNPVAHDGRNLSGQVSILSISVSVEKFSEIFELTDKA
jgi:hypothetical protein